MGRLNNKSAKRADGLYEVKVTVDHDFDGKPIRKSFYSSKSEKDARRKAEDYKVQLLIKKQTGQVIADNSFKSIVESLYSLNMKSLSMRIQDFRALKLRKLMQKTQRMK